MDMLKEINAALNYIEENLSDPIDLKREKQPAPDFCGPAVSLLFFYKRK